MDPNSYGVAKFSFESADESALTFKTGDVLTILDRCEGEWWLGEKNSKRGFFPHAFLGNLHGTPENWRVVVAKYSFTERDPSVPPERRDELLFYGMGELIVILDGNEKEEWWLGCVNGRVGFVSATFVSESVDVEAAEKHLESVFAPPKLSSGESSIILKVHLGENRTKAMRFDRSDLVEKVINTVRKKLKIQDKIQYGLFLPAPVSMWCNNELPLQLYDLNPYDEVVLSDLVKRDELEEDETGSIKRYARVICPYETEESNMTIAVPKGAVLEVIDMVSDEWWECRFAAQKKQGFVPRKFLGLLAADDGVRVNSVTAISPGEIVCSTTQEVQETIVKIQQPDSAILGLALPRCCLSTEHVTNLAESLSTNSSVTTLGLSHYALEFPGTDLPLIWESVKQRLTKLDLSHSSLTNVSPQISILSALKELALNNNNLVSLPTSLGTMTTLTSLNVSSNKIQSLPEHFHMLKNLEKLNLSVNKLTELPSYLLSLKKLQLFNVAKNPVKGYPKVILERGNQELFHYMANMLAGSKSVYRMKMMIVGQENVGKTSLMRALKKEKKGKKEKKEDRNLATDGIDIHEWHVKSNSVEEIEFSSWDFAGQVFFFFSFFLFSFFFFTFQVNL